VNVINRVATFFSLSESGDVVLEAAGTLPSPFFRATPENQNLELLLGFFLPWFDGAHAFLVFFSVLVAFFLYRAERLSFCRFVWRGLSPICFVLLVF